ncbi:MAG TPA: HAMP domain-containing sensor histidine kinase [Planctomycetota bacterium]|nr:HAMP domain-containing sensor histidine kinase [Planctomycetota bacterium]
MTDLPPGGELADLRKENSRLRRRLAELAASSDTFLSVATHDLRTPLASLRLVAELLAQPGRVNEDSASLLGIMQRSVEQMESLVNDVLNASRLSHPGDRLRLTEFELNMLVEDQLAGLFPVAMSKRIALDASLSPRAGKIRADRDRTGQMLTNLIGNALKFTPTGGTVVVATDGGGDWVECSVSDTGPGLEPGDREALFRAFSRASAVPTGGEPSTGLGLYITRRIAEAHGGTVGADGSPGRGSTFHFRLPRAAMEQPGGDADAEEGGR